MRKPRPEHEETISDRIVRLRQEAGLSQSGFAKKVGIDQRKVSRIENDPLRVDHYVVIRVAEVFQVRHEWLLTGAAPMKKEEASHEEGEDVTSLRLQVKALEEVVKAKDTALNLALKQIQLLEGNGTSIESRRRGTG